jgi:hypothetical protein
MKKNAESGTVNLALNTHIDDMRAAIGTHPQTSDMVDLEPAGSVSGASNLGSCRSRDVLSQI